MRVYCAELGGKSGSEAVYALLDHAYQAEHNRSLPEIEKTPLGKPYFPEHPDIHFSLSHTRTHVLCALADSPVGCDIESPRKISSSAMRFFCTPEELALFEPLELWVLKESFVKLFGWTVASIRRLRFSRDGETIIAPDSSVTARIYQVAGCTAAVCGTSKMSCTSIELV